MPRRADFFLMLTWHDKNAISMKRYLFRFNFVIFAPCGHAFPPSHRKTPPCGRDFAPGGHAFPPSHAKPCLRAGFGGFRGALRASHGHRGEIPKRVRADPVGANRVNLPAGERDTKVSPMSEKSSTEACRERVQFRALGFRVTV